jgi:adenylate kinase
MHLVVFGPNGSGKGTQGAILQKRFSVPHVESGAIFRAHAAQGTELGARAKVYADRGDLVPDEITVPMILDRLGEPDCLPGFLLDGYPRTPAQARALVTALAQAGRTIDCVVEITLDRAIAARRIMGRRLCARDNDHANNVAIAAIAPAPGPGGGPSVCRVCGGALTTRPDDQNQAAINKRHDVY